MTASSQDVRRPVVGPERREDYLAIMVRQRWLVAAVALTVIALVALYSYTRPPLYTAQADILVGSGIQSSTGSTAEPNMDTEAQLASSEAVAKLAADNPLLQPNPASLVKHVKIAVPENTQILQISYTSRDAEQARLGAQAFADAYLSFRSTQETEEATTRIQELASTAKELKSSINDLTATLQDPSISDEERALKREDLERKLAQLELIQAQRLAADTVTIDPGSIVGTPVKPTAPSSPNHRLDLALGLLAGIGLAFALAYVKDRNERRFEGATAMERWLDAPVLGVIPKFRKDRLWARTGVVQLYAANPAVAEAYRTLRTSVLWISRQRHLKSIVVASARAGEGKSTSAAMLSIALASSGKRVILISADLRTPAANRYMMVPTSPGLTDLLTGYIDSVKQVLQGTDVAGLTVLPSGAMPLDSSPTELLESDRMLKVLEECADADYTIIDVPSVLTVADALVLAPLADGVLFVAAARRTSPEMVELARVQLERIGAHIIGGLLVGARKLEGANPSYYYSVHPGTEMVRAAMSRSKRPMPNRRPDSTGANDGAGDQADTASGGAGSDSRRSARPAESVEVVSIPPHPDPVRVPPLPPEPDERSNETSNHEGQRVSATSAPPSRTDRHVERQGVADPSRDARMGPEVAQPAPKDDARPASGAAQKAAKPAPKDARPGPEVGGPEVAKPVPKDKATPAREATPHAAEPAPEDAARPASEATPHAAEPAPEDAARPASEATPQAAEPAPEDAARPASEATPQAAEPALEDAHPGPEVAQTAPQDARPASEAAVPEPKDDATPARGATPQPAVPAPKDAAKPASGAKPGKRARQRQRAKLKSSVGSRSDPLADDHGHESGDSSEEEPRSSGPSGESSPNGEAEAT